MDSKPLKIKDWAEEDRPREKMMAKGISALSDAELLAIIIGAGTQNETAVDLAKRLLNSVDNNLNDLWKQNISDFCKLKGIGKARAISIAAALELGRRHTNEEPRKRQTFMSSKEVVDVFQPMMADLPHEEFWILLINRAGRLIEQIKVSQGGRSEVSTDIKLIVKPAIEKLASGIIAIHNHPSGSSYPSDMDKKLTLKLKHALGLFNIQLLDHIIVCDTESFSFADEDIL